MADKPLVIVLMGSKSDWEVMRQSAEVLSQFGIEHEHQPSSGRGQSNPAETSA